MPSKKPPARPVPKPTTPAGVPAEASWPSSNVAVRLVSDLAPHARNARTHSKQQVALIAESIKEWGWTTPVLVTPKNVIIAGHGRLLAAELLGIESVPVMVAHGWTEAQIRAYVIADNQIALEAGWDKALLTSEVFALRELDFDLDLLGFESSEIKTMLRGPDQLDDDGPLPELPVSPTSRLGDVWIMEAHRVACGDATSAEQVAALLAGARPQLMVTDPPYGVNYDPTMREHGAGKKTKRTGLVNNDDRCDWTDAWKLFEGHVAYVWHSSLHASTVVVNLADVGLRVRSQIIWSKRSRFAMGRGNYHWAHEPCLYCTRDPVPEPDGSDHEACWYCVREGIAAKWIGGRKQTTVWEIDPPSTNSDDKTIHATQKPVECMARAMRNHDLPEVYDPFVGSGSTLIAAQREGRTCYAMEIDPRYVDIVVLRWQNSTGGSAVLEGDGRSFADVTKARAGRSKAKKKVSK